MAGPNNVDDFFDDLLAKGKEIIIDRKVLRHSWIPSTPVHREREWKEIGGVLGTSLRGGTPSNLLLYGLTGTGKTLVCRYVLRSLVKKVPQSMNSMLSYSYINCNEVDTKYRVFWKLCNDLGVSVPFTGIAFDMLHERLIKVLEQRGGLHIVVLDEVDVLYSKSKDSLYLLTRINSILTNSAVSLVCISNNTVFKENLDPRIRSSLSEEEFTFRPYNASQLQDILLSRAQIAVNMDSLSPGVIPYCASKAAQQHGDARRAIELLRVSAEIAERWTSNLVTEEHVDRAEAQIERRTVEEVIDSLPVQSKTVLAACYSLYCSKIQSSKSPQFYSGEVYDAYTYLCHKFRIDPLTARRVSDFLNELDMLGVLTCKTVSKGRHGRSKNINLSVSPQQIESVLKRDVLFESLPSIPKPHYSV